MINKVEQQDVNNSWIRELVKENRSAKRWKNARFFIGLLIFAFVVVVFFSNNNFVSLGGPSEEKGYVALIKLEGMIESGHDFSAEEVLPRLRDAFSDPQAKGVVLDINSGGGTPVQASIIHDAIIDMKKKFKKKVVVVGEDLMASGAYFVAVAADKIYVNPNTITGSIGVIMKGFGFTDLIKKVGIERRVYASGINKDRLDPFLPQHPDDVEKIKVVTNEIHDNFNQIVLEGRKGKLRADPQELFTGDFWSGKTAVKLGLVDKLGNLTDALSEEFHVSRYRSYSGSPSLLKSFMSQFGMTMNTVLNNDGVQVLEKI
ncbi:MAG: S49 family peptidase [Gammaproteobacteria bacterium]